MASVVTEGFTGNYKVTYNSVEKEKNGGDNQWGN